MSTLFVQGQVVVSLALTRTRDSDRGTLTPRTNVFESGKSFQHSLNLRQRDPAVSLRIGRVILTYLSLDLACNRAHHAGIPNSVRVLCGPYLLVLLD